MNFSLPVILTVAGYFVFSAAVGAMSPPTEQQKGGGYGWLYRFLQRLAANAAELEQARFGVHIADPLNPSFSESSALLAAVSHSGNQSAGATSEQTSFTAAVSSTTVQQ